MSRSPRPGQRTRREQGQATSGRAGAFKPGLPPSRRTKQRRTRGPGSALGARPRSAWERAQRLEMAVKTEEGLREASFSVLLVLGHPACETGAGGASLGCHFSRSIHDGRLRGWKISVGRFHGTKEGAAAGFGTAPGALPKMAAAAAREGGRSPCCFRRGPGRGDGDHGYPWLPGSPTRRRKR